MDTEFISDAQLRNVVDESYNDAVDEFLIEEYDLYDGWKEDKGDIGVAGPIRDIIKKILPEMRNNRSAALLGIMWRLRVQSVVFEVFMDLYDAQLVDISPLQYVVDLDGQNTTVWKMQRALSTSFEFGQAMNDLPRVAFCFSYVVPQLWLACMIVRGALAPLDTIVQFIAERGTLGLFDAEAFRKCWPENKELEIDPMAMAMIPARSQAFIGLHLPMGMGLPLKLEDVYFTIDEPLRRCEELFAKYFKIPETVFVPAGRIWMP
jgi:hypothetical protein